MENCMIDKQSPYVRLLLFSKRVLLVIVSETVEWAIGLSETVEWAIAREVAPAPRAVRTTNMAAVAISDFGDF